MALSRLVALTSQSSEKKQGLGDALADDECVECDGIYKGDPRFKNPQVSQSRPDRREKSGARSAHENVNGELKKFAVLDAVFRHNPKKKHQMCFEAVAVLVQLRHDFGGYRKIVEYNAQYD